MVSEGLLRPAGRSAGSVLLQPGVAFNGVKVFSATMYANRERLGEQVTQWLSDHPQRQATEMVVTQSSDDAFHCITITVFYREALHES
jgi:hypothetical protein